MMIKNEVSGATAQFIRIIGSEVMVRLADGSYAYWAYDRCISLKVD